MTPEELPYNLNSGINQVLPTDNNNQRILLFCIIISLILIVAIFVYNGGRLNIRKHLKEIKKMFKILFGFKEITNEIPNTDQVPLPPKKKEVFNIDNNDFTYKEAQLLCEALGCKLATYGQLIDAFNDGANWCNYGWSADGLALFPIQQSFYEQLQKDKKLKKKCGKPGINGGFFKNKNLKFGVNCYGPKPEPIDSRIVYSSNNTCNVDKSIITAYEKRLADGDIDVRPFNRNKWSDFSEQESAYIIPPEKKSDNFLKRDIELAISLN